LSTAVISELKISIKALSVGDTSRTPLGELTVLPDLDFGDGRGREERKRKEGRDGTRSYLGVTGVAPGQARQKQTDKQTDGQTGVQR